MYCTNVQCTLYSVQYLLVRVCTSCNLHTRTKKNDYDQGCIHDTRKRRVRVSVSCIVYRVSCILIHTRWALKNTRYIHEARLRVYIVYFLEPRWIFQFNTSKHQNPHTTVVMLISDRLHYTLQWLYIRNPPLKLKKLFFPELSHISWKYY